MRPRFTEPELFLILMSLAAVVIDSAAPTAAGALEALCEHQEIEHFAVALASGTGVPPEECTVLPVANLWDAAAVTSVLQWFESTGATHLLWITSPEVDLPSIGLRRLAEAAVDTGAAIAYSDYFDLDADGTARMHPLVDYQTGSLRDDFDFGHVLVLDGAALKGLAESVEQDAAGMEHGGWYALRLRLTERGPVVHLSEPTYSLPLPEKSGQGEAHFNYVDPRNRGYQIEMEKIATAHLKRIGAYLPTPRQPLVEKSSPFELEASVVIPVRNRERTVAEAVESVLAQQASFDFNLIVVDNHSTDGTTGILAEIAARDARLIHHVPQRTDLGIGGCWNEAVHLSACGRFAVQLDSDDLYDGTQVLERIVAEFHRTGCAMVIGSYSIVDFDLKPMPPGLVDHREWTDENGQNNALRIAGLGAPRAFHVPTLRTIGFPNLSFGEDYAVGLQMTRRWPLGRIYDSLYWCRRWEDNTDHALPLETSNRYAAYKDRLRSIEIAARQNLRRDG